MSRRSIVGIDRAGAGAAAGKALGGVHVLSLGSSRGQPGSSAGYGLATVRTSCSRDRNGATKDDRGRSESQPRALALAPLAPTPTARATGRMVLQGADRAEELGCEGASRFRAGTSPARTCLPGPPGQRGPVKLPAKMAKVLAKVPADFPGAVSKLDSVGAKLSRLSAPDASCESAAKAKRVAVR